MRRLDISEQIELAPLGAEYVPISDPLTGELKYVLKSSLTDGVENENIDWIAPLLAQADREIDGTTRQ